MDGESFSMQSKPPGAAPSGEVAANGSALAGVRVIDLSRVLGGPYCTQILGDHGADVIKVEPPQGDETRGWGPPFVDGSAAYFAGANRNKRGIALDLSLPSGRDLLLNLLSGADVLVENFKPGTLERWGIGYEQTLARQFPRLVHCRISGFGSDGPLGGLPGYDAAVQALSGLMSVNGEREGPPLRVGVPIVDMVTGLNGALGILLALQERERSGKGQFVESALFDNAVSILHPHMSNFLTSGTAPHRSGNAHPNITPYDAFLTATSSIFLAVGNDGQFRKFCDCIERPELSADPRFLTNQDRNANREILAAIIADELATRDGMAFAETLMRNGVPCAPVLGLPELIEHPHTRHRGMLVEMGAYRGTGAPVKLSRTPASYRLPPPKFAEHKDELLPHTRAAGEA